MTAPGVYPVEPASAPPGGPDGEVPAPPRGPGVAPPFAAPPTDRNRRGLWIGLGVGGLVLVLCCVGGLFGFGLILVSGAEKVKTEAHQVVTDYLSALQREDYNKAYDLLCPAATAHESADDCREGAAAAASAVLPGRPDPDRQHDRGPGDGALRQRGYPAVAVPPQSGHLDG